MKPGPKRQIRVDPETGCHIALCYVNKQGYPVYKHNGRRHTAARVVWMETHGPIPDGLQIDHLCRNPRCVNLEHLELVTCTENIRRSPRCKLTMEIAREIRASDERNVDLAKRYGVESSLIAQVRQGQIWREGLSLVGDSSGIGEPGYATVVADPPWKVHRPKGWGRGATSQSVPYRTMSLEWIRSLDVAALAAPDAHLYLWTINRYVREAYGVAESWGFKPSTLLVWAKAPHGIGPGEHFSITTEYVLFARRGSGRPEERHPTTWFDWPRGTHSEKPDAFYDLVEKVSPGPYVELFARRARFGWDYWGDESLGTVELLRSQREMGG